MSSDTRTNRRSRWTVTIVMATLTLLAFAAYGQSADGNEFRVCADPNNLPFSDRDGRGFENKLAELIAGRLGEHVTYTWWAQRRGFVRNTLNAGSCDVIMGVPTEFDMVETTRPYYRSGYVFVSLSDRRYDLRSIKDRRLRDLRIGVQLIGDDGFNTPPAHALSRQGIVRNVVGFSVYGNYRDPDPPARIVEAVESGEIDVAAVWGPLAGYVARHSAVPLTVAPIEDVEDFKPLQFQFDIAVGVRKGDHALRVRIDNVLGREHAEIARLMATYGVPTLNTLGSGGVGHN